MAEQHELRDADLRALLDDLCLARQAASLALWDKTSFKPAASVRLLERARTMLIIDQPVDAGSPVPTSPGQDAEISCALDVGLLRFPTWVRGAWTFGDPAAAPTLALAEPTKADVIQRRDAFRVNLIETQVRVEPWPLGAASWLAKARILNLSLSGAALVLDLLRCPDFRAADHYRLTLEASGDLPMLQLEARHIRTATPAPHRMLIGIAWQLDHARRTDRARQDHLSKFAASRQRPVLKRRSDRA